MFSRYFAIYPLLMKKLGRIDSKIILAPRGMLKQSALENKALKKRVYLSLFKMLNLHRIVDFQATDNVEKNDILKQFGVTSTIHVLSNFVLTTQQYNGGVKKDEGGVRIVFFYPVFTPFKNLDFLLSILLNIKGRIQLTICGAPENDNYFQFCQQIINKLPPNISVKIVGEVPYNWILSILNEHHILALPTKGENFGHVIFEALSGWQTCTN